jgi:hypothetical protein
VNFEKVVERKNKKFYLFNDTLSDTFCLKCEFIM